MADQETFVIPGEEVRGEVATDASTSRAAVPAGQPKPVGDSRLAAILARKEAGEKLSAAERGYLGAVKRKGSSKKVDAKANTNLLLEIPANADNQLFADDAKIPAAADAVFVAAANPAAIRKAAGAILDSVDLGTKLYVGWEAKQAGGDKETIEQWKAAVALQAGNRELMVDGSEPLILWLCEKFKCSPENLEKVLKNSGLVGGAFVHVVGVVTAVKSIRESKKERAENQTPAK